MSVVQYEEQQEHVKYIPQKLLVGGGPPNCSPRILFGLSQPPLAPTCNELFKLMDEIKTMLKHVFQTKNQVTFCIQSPGTGGIESVLCNVVEPGEKVLLAASGYWGKRTSEMAQRRKADVVVVWSELGDVFSLETLEQQIIKHKPVLLFIVHGESSVGVVQPLDGLGEICHKYDCLLAVDAIASLGSSPFFVDEWKIDIAISSCNKAMRGPTGVSYLTFSPKAVKRLMNCQTQSPFFYDLQNLACFWSCLEPKILYHYTFNSHLLFAAKEGLAEIIEIGLENVWKQHKATSQRLHSGMHKLGFDSFVKNAEVSSPMIALFRLPKGIDLRKLIKYASEKYHVEFGFGLGQGYSEEVSHCLRIGTMGYNSRMEVAEYLLQILEDLLKYFGVEHP